MKDVEEWRETQPNMHFEYLHTVQNKTYGCTLRIKGHRVERKLFATCSTSRPYGNSYSIMNNLVLLMV